jgi:hypothetical protein
MSYPVHQKYMSYDHVITGTSNDDFLKKHFLSTTNITFKDKYLKTPSKKLSNPLPTMLSSLNLRTSQSFKTTLSSLPTNRTVVRNKKLLIENQLKLPTVGYMVTGLKATNFCAAQANIKERLLQSKATQELSPAEVEQMMKAQRDERRRASLVSFDSDESEGNEEEKLEKIRQADPHNVLTQRKEVTIHKRMSKLMLAETGFKTEADEFEDSALLKEVEIENLKTELNEIQTTNKLKSKYQIVDVLCKQAEKRRVSVNNRYKLCKDAKQQLHQKKLLSMPDCSIFSRLHMLNSNPVFTFNTKVSLPAILDDNGLLANIYNVNMYKMRNFKGE